MDIKLERGGDLPLYRQIAGQLRARIADGSLAPGDTLPPERKLADALAVNRTTVLSAYQELKADGLVQSVVGRGTIVVGPANGKLEPSPGSPPPLPWKQLMNRRSNQIEFQLIHDLLRRPVPDDRISFEVGNPPPECIPLHPLQALLQEITEEFGADLFQHGPVEGYYPLRQSICELMRTRGIHGRTAENVMVLSGAQQGLDLIARAFIEPGDVVFVEEPTYFSALHVFQTYGAKLIGMPNDGDGQLNLDSLDSLLGRYRPKFIYLLPTFQNPSGRVLSREQRLRVLDLAYRYQTFVVEEDPYFEIRYEGEPVPPLQALDAAEYVIYVGTFSKLLYPGMRVGWVCAPVPIVQLLSRLKQMTDLHTNQLAQVLTDRFYRRGLLLPHLRELISVYRAKRDIMLRDLRRSPVPLSCQRPDGGLFLWVRLPEFVRGRELLLQASGRGVTFVPGDHFFAGFPAAPFIRLNFTAPSSAEIEEGIERLVRTIGSMMQYAEQKGRASYRRDTTPLV